jgi:hypothetical protein
MNPKATQEKSKRSGNVFTLLFFGSRRSRLRWHAATRTNDRQSLESSPALSAKNFG